MTTDVVLLKLLRLILWRWHDWWWHSKIARRLVRHSRLSWDERRYSKIARRFVCHGMTILRLSWDERRYSKIARRLVRHGMTILLLDNR